MKRNIKVRFNLGKGKNYLKWKVQTSTGIEYYYPADVQLVLKNCKLKNSLTTAQKIFNGENKTVCAWILCEDIIIKHNDFQQHDIMKTSRLRYNPRVKPFWTLDDEGLSIDGNEYKEIVSVDYKLYVENKFGSLER